MKKLIFAVCLFFSVCGFAQSRISEHNSIGWYAFFVSPRITDKLSGHIEYQWRREDFISNWQQSLSRIGLTYKINSQVSVQAGYGWIVTYPYGKYSLAAVPKDFPEHRIYEQLQVTTPVGKTTLSHRLRLEQRWLGRLNSIQSEKPDSWIFLNRFRYMPRLDVPLNDKLYTALYDEIFIGFGKNVGENVFDQNRVALLLGYRFSKAVRAEAGFLNQTVQLAREIDNKNVFQYNNGFIINTYININ
ncbi:DUF2490 domain-containing protein [Foetidibacter luteolus]|uniref:DUF2490 domain-containing protein n=1 Tax=Foetidibacter luteolus TaxID=2608880 RepID=UPI00129BBB41|nr:DUF2490 domain-containing protein [Foetidibacter luteolus]